jgi:hypothetical protein
MGRRTEDGWPNLSALSMIVVYPDKRKLGPCPCRLLCFHVEYSIHHICLRKIGILFAGVTVLNQNETMFLDVSGQKIVSKWQSK